MLVDFSQFLPKNLAKKIESKETRMVSGHLKITWIDKDLENISLHDFIEVFEFKPLSVVKQSLSESADYNSEELSDLIEGLSRLPGYASKQTRKSRRASRSQK